MDTERIIEELRPIADKLGEGAEALWTYALTEVYASAVTNAVVALMFLLFTIALVKLALYCQRREVGCHDDNMLWAFLSWAGVAMTGFATLLGTIKSARMFYNPEWYAIRFIMERFIGS